jgi:hypothetical protein
MIKTMLRIGPTDQGRRLSLADFEAAEVREGYIYELARGVVAVSDIPGLPHFRLVNAVKRPLFRYQERFPDEIYEVLGSMECKLLVGDFESERHPDLAIYKTKPPRKEDFWQIWIPEIVVKVVSRGSVERDYVAKREEYLALGIKEYGIVDGISRQILILRGIRGKWSERVLEAGDVYTTKLLPGFRLDCAKVLQAAE